MEGNVWFEEEDVDESECRVRVLQEGKERDISVGRRGGEGNTSRGSGEKSDGGREGMEKRCVEDYICENNEEEGKAACHA